MSTINSFKNDLSSYHVMKKNIDKKLCINRCVDELAILLDFSARFNKLELVVEYFGEFLQHMEYQLSEIQCDDEEAPLPFDN